MRIWGCVWPVRLGGRFVQYFPNPSDRNQTPAVLCGLFALIKGTGPKNTGGGGTRERKRLKGGLGAPETTTIDIRYVYLSVMLYSRKRYVSVHLPLAGPPGRPAGGRREGGIKARAPGR